MPGREDEYWAARREGRLGKSYCPYCGSEEVYFNSRFKSWRCGSCEKSFSEPHWGTANGKGKESSSGKVGIGPRIVTITFLVILAAIVVVAVLNLVGVLTP